VAEFPATGIMKSMMTSSPTVAVDGFGNTIVVWAQYDNGNVKRIYKGEYCNGEWVTPVDLNDYISPVGLDAREPKVAMDDNGNAVIVWKQKYGGFWYLYRSEYRNGIWKHPVNLNDYIGLKNLNAENHELAMSNNGEAIIAWASADSSAPLGLKKIYKTDYRVDPTGGRWAPISGIGLVNNFSLGANKLSVSMNSSGETILAYSLVMPGGSAKIFLSEYRGGVWSHPRGTLNYISPHSSADADYPSAAISSTGDSIIAWTQKNNSNGFRSVYKSVYRLSTGTWVHPSSIADYFSPKAGDASLPKVAIYNGSNMVIVWIQMVLSYSKQRVFISEYRDGLGWIHPGKNDYISPGNDIYHNSAKSPVVSANDHGHVVVAWGQHTGASQPMRAFMSEFRDGMWKHPASLTDFMSAPDVAANEPRIGMGSSGAAVIGYVGGIYGPPSTMFMLTSEYRPAIPKKL